MCVLAVVLSSVPWRAELGTFLWMCYLLPVFAVPSCTGPGSSAGLQPFVCPVSQRGEARGCFTFDHMMKLNKNKGVLETSLFHM